MVFFLSMPFRGTSFEQKESALTIIASNSVYRLSDVKR
jgi:hypothetical protein